MKTHYPKMWLDKATQANNAAEILNNAGRVEEARRLLDVAKYCWRRYENAMQMQAISQHKTPERDNTMLISGLVIVCAMLAAAIYCAIKSNL